VLFGATIFMVSGSRECGARLCTGGL